MGQSVWIRGLFCNPNKTRVGYFFCLVMVAIAATFSFHVASSLGFLERISKTRADFAAGLRNQWNRHLQHGRLNKTSLNCTGNSDGVSPVAEVSNWRGGYETDSSDLVKMEKTSKKEGVDDGLLNSENIDSSQGTDSLLSKGECDLFTGKWIPDQNKSIYKNDSCPILSQPQNCEANGRPDSGYLNWRWKPSGCLLPLFDAEAFLQKMQGKVIAFVGDSIARNHMESLMCCLMQVETPRNRGYRKMQRWHFPLHSVTIIRIWSAWLVTNSKQSVVAFTPADATNLYLEQADEAFMEFLPKFHVLIISSGHWFAKKSAYILAGKVVGGQGWWQNTSSFQYNSSAAFAIAMQTALHAIVQQPDYDGLTILRTYSPDHYHGGQWNSGGSCSSKTAPFTDAELPNNPFTDLMRQHQLNAFQKAKSSMSNKSKLRLMDVSAVFNYRGDGHPGPYRSVQPIPTNHTPPRAAPIHPHHPPPTQDCLHWCMPGPIDTWNEFLFEILKQELFK